MLTLKLNLAVNDQMTLGLLKGVCKKDYVRALDIAFKKVDEFFISEQRIKKLNKDSEN